MREILFRGKRKDNGEWIYGDLRNYSENSKGIFDYETKHTIQVIPETIGQYTGLTANGTRIFEGDILQLCSGTYPIKVIYDGLGWKFIRNGKRVEGAFECDIIHDIEICQVIGNVFDNPELMKGE